MSTRPLNRVTETMRMAMRFLKMTSRIAVLILFCSVAAHAQSTTVSGTITDSNGQAFIGGTYNIVFYSNGLPPPFNWNGSVLSQYTSFSGVLDGTGSFSGVSVPSSNYITPTGTAWTFTVCPNSTSPCYSQIIPVTGSTLSVSSLISPPAIQMNITPFVRFTAYSDSEVVGGVKGSQYFNLTDNTIHACIALPCSSNWQSIQYTGSSVNSFNTRTGNVVSTTGDYSLSQITATYDPLLTLNTNALVFTNQMGDCFIASPSNGTLGNMFCRTIVSGDLPATISSNTTGNAATATTASTAATATTASTAAALSGTPTTCGAGIAATGILANGNATGCFTPVVGDYFKNKALLSSVSVSSNTTTNIDSITVSTFPSAGGPWRVRVNYGYFQSGGVSYDCWITDGTNTWGNFEGTVGNNRSSCSGGGESPFTYANGAGPVTFSVEIYNSGSSTITQSSNISGSPATGSAMQILIYSSN